MVMMVLVNGHGVDDDVDESTQPSSKLDLQRVVVSQLLEAPGSGSPVAKNTKSNVQKWVGEVNRLLPEYFSNVTRPQKFNHANNMLTHAWNSYKSNPT